MVVRWRRVPKELHERLRVTHDKILELVKDETPGVIKEYFGIDWEDLDKHAVETVERLEEFYKMVEESGQPIEKALQTTYVMGFLSGIRYALDEDHEPDN